MTTLKTDPIIALADIRQYLSPKFETRRVPGGKMKYSTKPESKHFKKIFDRHFADYQSSYPGASVEQYRQYSIEWLSRKIEICKQAAPKHWDNEAIQWAEIYINDVLRAETNQTGIDSILDADQLARLYRLMDGYIKAKPADFITALTPEPLPPSFKRLKWIDKATTGKNTGKSNHATLRAFIMAIKGSKPMIKDDLQKFVDIEGKPFKAFSNPQGDQWEERNIKKFKTLISKAKGE